MWRYYSDHSNDELYKHLDFLHHSQYKHIDNFEKI